MSPITKLASIGFGMSLTLATIVAFSGRRIDQLLDQQAIVDMLQADPALGWLTATVLLMADLFLPIPGSAVITGLGMVYGALLGAVIGASALLIAGLSAYGLAALGGKRVAHWIASEAEMSRFRTSFDRWGTLAMVTTRMLPIIPEVLCVLAGLVGMSLGRFAVAQAIAGVPMAVLFAWIGEAFLERPGVGFALGLGLPFVLWAVLHFAGLIDGPQEQGEAPLDS